VLNSDLWHQVFSKLFVICPFCNMKYVKGANLSFFVWFHSFFSIHRHTYVANLSIIVLYLKRNSTQLFFFLPHFAVFKKNSTQQHSCSCILVPSFVFFPMTIPKIYSIRISSTLSSHNIWNVVALNGVCLLYSSVFLKTLDIACTEGTTNDCWLPLRTSTDDERDLPTTTFQLISDPVETDKLLLKQEIRR